MSRRLRILIGGVIGGGATIVATAGVVSVGSVPAEPWRILLVAVAFLGGETAMFHVRIGKNNRSFTWAETACVIALAVAPGPWAILLGPAAVAVAHGVRRRPPVKVAFNAASVAVGLLAARSVATFAGVTSERTVLQRTDAWLGLALAAAVYFLVTTALVSAAVAWSSGSRLRDVHRRDLPLNALVGAGNISLGVLVVATAAVKPTLLIPFPLLLGMLTLIYRSYLRATQERDTWESLQAASKELIVADDSALVPAILQRAAELFSAEAVDLLVVRHGQGLLEGWRAAVGQVAPINADPFSMPGALWGRALCDQEPFEVRVDRAPAAQQAEMLEAGLESSFVAPLLIKGDCIGTLRVGFSGKVALGRRERQIFTTFANSVSAALHNSRLFGDLRAMALHDALTGLPNRALLLERATAAQARVEGTATGVALLFLDLDRFKVVNDSLGHEVGDEMLVTVARRISAALRPGDTAARFGGDEFVILCENIRDDQEGAEIAERIGALVAAPMSLRGREVVTTASIGVVTAQGAGWQPSGLIRDADAAMYRAKDRGRDRSEIFDDEMRTSLVARLDLEGDLRHAVERRELRLYFQPLVRAADQRVTGVEALIRWQHPERGLVPPVEFIPIAEDTGFIKEIGAWVLDEACRQLADWRMTDGLLDDDFEMAVNLSAHQAGDPRLVALVVETLRKYHLPSHALCLEITETALLQDTDEVRSNLEELRALGVHFALDDFGTGYSALSHLHMLPVDILKIDRSFVGHLDTGGRERAIVTGLIDLGHALGMRIVAEGVETARQLVELNNLGCDIVQGYYISRPCPALEIEQMLSFAPVL